MTFIKPTLPDESLPETSSTPMVARYLTTHVARVLRFLRREVNKTSGDLVRTSEATYDIQLTDRTVICDAECIASLPAASTCREQLFTVIRISTAGAVTVSAQAGEDISGSSSLSVAAGRALTVLSDGVSFHRMDYA